MKQKFYGKQPVYFTDRTEADSKVQFRADGESGLAGANPLGFLNTLAGHTQVQFNIADTISAIRGGSYSKQIVDQQINENRFTSFVKQNTLWVGIGGTLLVAAIVGLIIWHKKAK